MAANSKIEWTDNSWNPITGCTKYSDGCQYCYAEKLAKRLKLMGLDSYRNEFDLTIHEKYFTTPLTWKKTKRIFVCSMSDLFHKDVPYETISKIFDTMKLANWHVFQVLTKRSDRLLEFSKIYDIPENVWTGVTIESARYLDRLDDLKNTVSNFKFISFEPLLSLIPQQDFTGIDWIIVGGESGTNPRDIQKEWVIDLKDNSKLYNVAFFFKQWGGKNKKKAGNLLDNKYYEDIPNVLDFIKSIVAV